MPEGKRTRPEGTKKMLKSMFLLFLRERCQKSVKKPGKVRDTMQMASFFHSCVPTFHFSFMPCQERTCVNEQKHTLQGFDFYHKGLY